VRAPTTIDTNPTTTTRTADARSGSAWGPVDKPAAAVLLRVVLTAAITSRPEASRRAAALGPSVVSVVPIARFASHACRGRSRIGTAAPPADYVVRNSGRASAGISLHFPSA
jgi:hypothetical protein